MYHIYINIYIYICHCVCFLPMHFFWQYQCQNLAMQNVCAKGAWVLGWDGAVMTVSHLVHGFSHVYSFKGSLLASHGFQFYWLQRPLWLPMSCQAVIPPHQYHNSAIPISKQVLYHDFLTVLFSKFEAFQLFFVLNVHHIHD